MSEIVEGRFGEEILMFFIVLCLAGLIFLFSLAVAANIPNRGTEYTISGYVEAVDYADADTVVVTFDDGRVFWLSGSWIKIPREQTVTIYYNHGYFTRYGTLNHFVRAEVH